MSPSFWQRGFSARFPPYVAPKNILISIRSIKLPCRVSKKQSVTWRMFLIALGRDLANWPYYFADITMDQARKCKQAYFATQSFVDAQVGRLVDALEKNDILDKTIIVFGPDHGYFLGEKGLWYKAQAFERSTRVPLIISAPGMAKGERSNKPVELLDLYPTLMDLCGISGSDRLQGQSLRPLLNNPNAEDWTKPAVTLVWYGRDAWGYSLQPSVTAISNGWRAGRAENSMIMPTILKR